MKKLIFWVIKIISAFLLIIPIILSTPGVILHVLGEEFYDKYLNENE